jgi:hypothetical protein
MARLLETLKHKPTSWILAAALLVMALQNSGLLGRVTDVFGGDQTRAAQDVQATREALTQHLEQSRQMNEKLDTVNKQLEWNRQTSAQGLRILCLTQAKTDTQRYECGKIQ